METVITGYANGQPIFGEELNIEEMVAVLKASPEWVAITEKYDMDLESNRTLMSMLYKTKLGDDPTVEQYKTLYTNILRAGGIVTVDSTQYEFELKPKEPEVIEEDVPRDHTGKPLTASQIAWSEYRVFADGHNMQECRERARTDAAFNTFMQKNYERETAEVGDAANNLSARNQRANQVSDDLKAWVSEYLRTPSEQVRKLRRADFNPLGHAAYNINMQAAIDAGLI